MSKRPVRIATLTLSDTRTPADDEGGRLLGELLRAAGFTWYPTPSSARTRPPPRRRARALRGADVAAVVLTGGTGIAPRDRTIEVLAPLFDKTLDGFGEAFRRLSWDEIGPRAILSRATAGVSAAASSPPCRGASGRAARRAALLAPTLAHAVDLASGRGGHHHPK